MAGKLGYTMTAKDAMQTDLKVDVIVKLSRPYIWMLKIRLMWSILRADFKGDSQSA